MVTAVLLAALEPVAVTLDEGGDAEVGDHHARRAGTRAVWTTLVRQLLSEASPLPSCPSTDWRADVRAEAFGEAADLVERGCDRDARMHLVDEVMRGKAAQVRALAGPGATDARRRPGAR